MVAKLAARAMAAGALLMAVPAMAQVTAADPQSVVDALKMGGYKAELKPDQLGDPSIETELSNQSLQILFYGCDEETHDGCDSLQFYVGFDSDKPMSAEKAMEFMAAYRYGAITLDDEGDPWMAWDMVTGEEGLPVPTFLTGVRAFSDAMGAMQMFVWPED